MPIIACPGCGKQYKIAATAAGQVAKCACGKRFRLGGASPSGEAAPPAAKSAAAKTASTSTAVAAPSPKRATTTAPATPAPKPPAAKAAPANDDFWDDTLPATNKPAPTAAASTSTAKTLSGAPVPAATKSKPDDAPKKKKKKKSGGVKWGFDWGKVVAGLGSFLIFGGITAAIAMSTGRISIYLSILAVGGLVTALSGLMGEEGIW